MYLSIGLIIGGMGLAVGLAEDNDVPAVQNTQVQKELIQNKIKRDQDEIKRLEDEILLLTGELATLEDHSGQ